MQSIVKNLSLVVFAGLAFNVGYYFYFDFSLIKYLTYLDHILSVWSLVGMAFLAISLMTDLEEIENPRRSLSSRSALILLGVSLLGLVLTAYFFPNLLFLSALGVYYFGSDVARYGHFLSKDSRFQILVASTLLAISVFGYHKATQVASSNPIKVCGGECAYAISIFVGEKFSMFLSDDKIRVVPTSEIRLIELDASKRVRASRSAREKSGEASN